MNNGRLAWEILPFEKVIADVSGGSVKTLQSEFLPEGSFPVVDQGKSLIAGFSNDSQRLCGVELPVVIFGDHTRAFKYIDFPFCIGADGVKVLRPKVDAHVKYLFHYFQQLQLTNGGYDRHFKYLKRVEIPLPPLAEQQRIAGILDAADALRAQRRRSLARLDDLARSLFLHHFGDPVSNPKGWPVKSLTALCHCYSGGTPSKGNPEFWKGNLPWFSAKDMKQDDLFDAQDHISRKVTEETNLKELPANTVAIVVRGMILAHTFPVCVLRVPAAINQDLKALLPREPVESQYLAASLRAQSQHVLESRVSVAAHGTTKISTYELDEIPIPLPPLAHQRRFAAELAVVETMKAHQRAHLAKLDALFASLQNRAFSGKL